jgi:hypothetical protein
MRLWNLVAEVLGFLSGCLLVWPALTQNEDLRAAWKFRGQIMRAPGKIAEYLRSEAALAKPHELRWSLADQWMLTAGVAALVLSFLIKILVVWHSP